MSFTNLLIKFPGIFFKGPPAKRRYLAFLAKKCVTARRVDLAFLESEGLTCTHYLREFDWEPVLELDELVYESYTKLFYANLDNEKEDCSLKVYLKGREVEITPTLLNHILGVPDEGALINPRKGDLGIKEYHAPQWILLISGGKSRTTLKGDMLSKNRKVLLYIISQIIYPKKGGLSNISGFEAFLLWAIEVGYKLNLGYLIIKHMLYELHKERAPFPYGVIITRILRYFDFDMSFEVGKSITEGNIMNASWTQTLSYQGRKLSKSKTPKGSQKRKQAVISESSNTSSEATPEPPSKKSKGIKIQEGVTPSPPKFRSSDSSRGKGKQVSDHAEKEQAKLLKKHVREIQQARYEGSSRKSPRLQASSSPSAFSGKSNTPDKPILIYEDEEEPEDLAPLLYRRRAPLRTSNTPFHAEESPLETPLQEASSPDGFEHTAKARAQLAPFIPLRISVPVEKESTQKSASDREDALSEGEDEFWDLDDEFDEDIHEKENPERAIILHPEFSYSEEFSAAEGLMKDASQDGSSASSLKEQPGTSPAQTDLSLFSNLPPLHSTSTPVTTIPLADIFWNTIFQSISIPPNPPSMVNLSDLFPFPPATTISDSTSAIVPKQTLSPTKTLPVTTAAMDDCSWKEQHREASGSVESLFTDTRIGMLEIQVELLSRQLVQLQVENAQLKEQLANLPHQIGSKICQALSDLNRP